MFIAKVILITALASGAVASSQDTPVPFVSSKALTALIEQAEAQRKEGQPGVSKPLLNFPPYTANVEYHVVAGPAAVHRHSAELFYVLRGTAVLMVGGTLLNASAIDSENERGTGIQGGAAQSITKGDVLIIPENTAHGFKTIQGSIVLMTMKLPHHDPRAD